MKGSKTEMVGMGPPIYGQLGKRCSTEPLCLGLSPSDKSKCSHALSVCLTRTPKKCPVFTGIGLQTFVCRSSTFTDLPCGSQASLSSPMKQTSQLITPILLVLSAPSGEGEFNATDFLWPCAWRYWPSLEISTDQLHYSLTIVCFGVDNKKIFLRLALMVK